MIEGTTQINNRSLQLFFLFTSLFIRLLREIRCELLDILLSYAIITVKGFGLLSVYRDLQHSIFVSGTLSLFFNHCLVAETIRVIDRRVVVSMVRFVS
jgi:hypothetical protein